MFSQLKKLTLLNQHGGVYATLPIYESHQLVQNLIQQVFKKSQQNIIAI